MCSFRITFAGIGPGKSPRAPAKSVRGTGKAADHRGVVMIEASRYRTIDTEHPRIVIYFRAPAVIHVTFWLAAGVCYGSRSGARSGRRPQVAWGPARLVPRAGRPRVAWGPARLVSFLWTERAVVRALRVATTMIMGQNRRYLPTMTHDHGERPWGSG